MSILNLTQEEEIQLDVMGKLRRTNSFMYKTMNLLHKAAFNFVWKNSIYSPKVIIESMGTDAGLIFTISGKIQEILKILNPDYQPLVPTCMVTFNEDGSANVIENG